MYPSTNTRINVISRINVFITPPYAFHALRLSREPQGKTSLHPFDELQPDLVGIKWFRTERFPVAQSHTGTRYTGSEASITDQGPESTKVPVAPKANPQVEVQTYLLSFEYFARKWGRGGEYPQEPM